MPNITFNISGIVSLLKNLKLGKATGPDDYIHAEQIVTVLQVNHLIQAFYQMTGTRPVFKKGDR